MQESLQLIKKTYRLGSEDIHSQRQKKAHRMNERPYRSIPRIGKANKDNNGDYSNNKETKLFLENSCMHACMSRKKSLN